MIEAGSLEELDGMLNQLPFFGLVKWQIKALMPFEATARQLPQYIANARQMMQSGGPPPKK